MDGQLAEPGPRLGTHQPQAAVPTLAPAASPLHPGTEPGPLAFSWWGAGLESLYPNCF